MEYQIIPLKNRICIECLPYGGIISDERSALDLLGICGEEQADSILLYSTNLNDDFYNLKTGLAGTLMLKWTTYKIIVAAIIPSDRIGTGRFYEMVLETNRRKDFRVFPSRDEAVAWLDSLP